jgi:large conductance mechanosensitive channel protein
MSLGDDFRAFALKGNVVDLAVGVIVGGAFGKIVTALVNDLVMPFVALALPSGDWRTAGLVLRHGADAKDDVVLRYGDFLATTIDFLVVACALPRGDQGRARAGPRGGERNDRSERREEVSGARRTPNASDRAARHFSRKTSAPPAPMASVSPIIPRAVAAK